MSYRLKRRQGLCYDCNVRDLDTIGLLEIRHTGGVCTCKLNCDDLSARVYLENSTVFGFIVSIQTHKLPRLPAYQLLIDISPQSEIP